MGAPDKTGPQGGASLARHERQGVGEDARTLENVTRRRPARPRYKPGNSRTDTGQ